MATRNLITKMPVTRTSHEQRMQSFEEVYEIAKQKALSCDFDSEIIVGRQADFSEDELLIFPAKVLIHGGIIYYTGNLSAIHQLISARLGQNVVASLKSRMAIIGFSGYPQPFVNELGCHAKWSKIPDQAIAPDHLTFRLRTIYQTNLIPMEVAFRNESLFQLICEGVGWTNSRQPMSFSCILVKIELDRRTGEYSMRIMVISKRQSTSQSNPRAIRTTATCPEGSLLNPRWNSFVPRSTIEEYFGFPLLFDHIFTPETLREIYEGQRRPIMMPLEIYNPHTGAVDSVEIDIFNFVYECAVLFFT